MEGPNVSATPEVELQNVLVQLLVAIREVIRTAIATGCPEDVRMRVTLRSALKGIVDSQYRDIPVALADAVKINKALQIVQNACPCNNRAWIRLVNPESEPCSLDLLVEAEMAMHRAVFLASTIKEAIRNSDLRFD